MESNKNQSEEESLNKKPKGSSNGTAPNKKDPPSELDRTIELLTPYWKRDQRSEHYFRQRTEQATPVLQGLLNEGWSPEDILACYEHKLNQPGKQWHRGVVPTPIVAQDIAGWAERRNAENGARKKYGVRGAVSGPNPAPKPEWVSEARWDEKPDWMSAEEYLTALKNERIATGGGNVE